MKDAAKVMAVRNQKGGAKLPTISTSFLRLSLAPLGRMHYNKWVTQEIP